MPALSAEAAAQDQPVNTFRETYPRTVSALSPTYDPANLDPQLPGSLRATWASKEWATNNTIGSLPPLPAAVASALGVITDATYATVEGLYSIVNSREVAVAESTSSAMPELVSLARTHASQTRREGALWDISALSRVALARCATARCAIDLMGYLAVRDGFYGGHGRGAVDASANGETLLVADPTEACAYSAAPQPPAACCSRPPPPLAPARARSRPLAPASSPLAPPSRLIATARAAL